MRIRNGSNPKDGYKQPKDKKTFTQKGPQYVDVFSQKQASSAAKRFARGIVIAVTIILLAIILLYVFGG